MSEFAKYQDKRDSIQKELNSQIVAPLSFEVFKKTDKEKMDLKNAKSMYKQLNK